MTAVELAYFLTGIAIGNAIGVGVCLHFYLKRAAA
jgi:hypothetical protein